MNPQNKELFIFNYLEDNLSVSEKELAEDLYQTDSTFKKDVDLFKLSYYQQSDAKVVLSNKLLLYPKSNFKYYATALSIVAFVSTYFFFNSLKTENQALKNQIASYSSILSTINNKKEVKVIASSEPETKKEKLNEEPAPSGSKTGVEKNSLKVVSPKETIAIDVSAFYTPITYNQVQGLKVEEEVVDVFEDELMVNTKEKTVRQLTLMQKINNARVKMKYKKHKEKSGLATWQEIKDAFKSQKVVPMK